MNSFDTMSLDRVSYDRYYRYGPYGYGENETREIPGWSKPSKVHWDAVQWGKLQRDCMNRNKNRYKPNSIASAPDPWIPRKNDDETDNGNDKAMQSFRKRTAVVMRAYTDFEYSQNDLHNIRSLIVELSLRSGAEYEMFLLVHVKDETIPIFSDWESYDNVIRSNVPPEFWDMTELFNLGLLSAWYPKIKEHV